jgi:hypothetical protein
MEPSDRSPVGPHVRGEPALPVRMRGGRWRPMPDARSSSAVPLARRARRTLALLAIATVILSGIAFASTGGFGAGSRRDGPTPSGDPGSRGSAAVGSAARGLSTYAHGPSRRGRDGGAASDPSGDRRSGGSADATHGQEGPSGGGSGTGGGGSRSGGGGGGGGGTGARGGGSGGGSGGGGSTGTPGTPGSPAGSGSGGGGGGGSGAGGGSEAGATPGGGSAGDPHPL